VTVSVRAAGDDDVPTLAALRRAWNEEGVAAGTDDAEFAEAFAAWWSAERSTRTFFVVEVDGAAVGMVNVKRYDRMPVAGRPTAGCWGYVGNLFVLPQQRHTGLGTRLMRALTEWAWAQGMEHLRLAPSDLARPLYERLGFVAGAVVQLDPPS
jgi:GNAT superfamily N-acetyltransferase